MTDPPAGISFMGKEWDDDKGGRRQWIDWMAQVMTECMRVMKPGAHGLVWAIPRTSHWTATALEDAGFEIRDVVTHLFGSGFPKSMDISKAIDKAAGAEREVIEMRKSQGGRTTAANPMDRDAGKTNKFDPITAPATDAAKEWSGWGTALKPASEHWILIRKPISEKTVAANLLKWGTGGINIDGCRVAASANDPNARANKASGKCDNANTFKHRAEGPWDATQGRFPANLVLSHSPNCTEDACDLFECPVKLLDEQSGTLKSGDLKPYRQANTDTYSGSMPEIRDVNRKGDSGGASRFFYVAKPSKREKNAGCDDIAVKAKDKGGSAGHGNHNPTCLDCGLSRFNRGKGICECDQPNWKAPKNETFANSHPTVKPVKLMRYLIRMITPPNGIVIDPFTGSGTTGVAALKEGFKFLGIEREAEYVKIANARMEAVV